MSNFWLNQISAADRPRGPARVVLLTLADMANENGQCWPSLATLARRSGVSRRTVIRALAQLQQGSPVRITVERRRGAARGSLTNLYTLELVSPASADCAGTPTGAASPGVPDGHQGGDGLSPEMVSPGHQGGGTLSPGMVSPGHQGGDAASPEPSLNHQMEPFINRTWRAFLQAFRENRIYDLAMQAQVTQQGNILAVLCPQEHLALLEARLGPYARRFFAPYVDEVEFLVSSDPRGFGNP